MNHDLSISILSGRALGGGSVVNVCDGDLGFFAEDGDGRVTHVGVLASGGRLLHASTTRNGVAWSALRTDDPSHDAFGSKLVSWLTEVRRVV